MVLLPQLLYSMIRYSLLLLCLLYASLNIFVDLNGMAATDLMNATIGVILGVVVGCDHVSGDY